MSPSSPTDQLNWKRDEPIAVPAPAKEGRLAIRRLDWARIRRNLAQLADPLPNLTVWYSLCFGVAISFGVSIIPIRGSKDLPAWVTPFYVCVTVAALILGVLLVILSRALSKNRGSRLDDLKTDMDQIESTFGAGTSDTE